LRGLRRGRQGEGIPAFDRAPAQVPGQDGALQRAGGPHAVHDGRAAVIAVHAIVPLATETSSDWVMYAGIGALGVGLLVLLVLAIPKQRSLTTEERVAQYAARPHAGLPASGAPIAPPPPQDSPLESAKSAA